jgi:hypothetical protein
MFVPCPHCGFLVALIVRPDGAPQRCPRCEQLIEPLDANNADAPIGESSGHGPAGDPAHDTRDEAPHTASIAATGTAVDDDTADLATAATHVEPTKTDAAPSYEDAIAAVAVGTPARTNRRAARPRRKGAPSFARHAAPDAPVRVHWGWYAGVAGLVLLLALQLLLAQRHELAADPRWRPLVAGACSVLQCEVPAWREPNAFTMLQRSVRPKPGQSGVLAVDASFRNDARWPQPWPTLVLNLSDVDGRPVGARAFTPDEYRREHRAADRLLPGQSATVTMEVVEPAPRIVAFTFDFR